MKVLLAVDGSRYALAATRFVCEYLAQPGRHVDVLHVLPLTVQEGAAQPRHQPEHLRIPPESRRWLDRAEKLLRARGFTVARHVRRGFPARVVPELVAKGGYDLVVLGAKGRSDIPYLPTGSVALAMLEHDVAANLLLVRGRQLRKKRDVMTRGKSFPVLFATDGSPRVELAARSFYRMFRIPDLRPIAVAVTELPGRAALAGMRSEDRKQLIRLLGNGTRGWAREAKPLLARPGVRPQALALQGRAAAAIVEEAGRIGARLIVLGSRGVKSPSGPPLGSVALQIARFAPCSILLVRER